MARPPTKRKLNQGRSRWPIIATACPLMRTCCRAALLKALHLPPRAHGGHRALILAFSIPDIRRRATDASRRRGYQGSNSGPKGKCAEAEVRLSRFLGRRPPLKGLQQRRRLATEEIGQDRAAVR